MKKGAKLNVLVVWCEQATIICGEVKAKLKKELDQVAAELDHQ
jgi:hypothetical protein